ncbi:MAG TPA: hypothetical protein VNC11_12070 [Gemmatimonadaceae bacterium]|nr:hypothetical protein [Gemmatimonadaceae bacterium]
MKIAVILVAATITAAAPPPREPARQVEVIAVDYAFKLPASLPPGLTTFHFRNDSQHPHEFNVFLLKKGATIEEVIKAGKENKSQMQYVDGPVGVLFAGKGKNAKSTLTTNLLPGRVYGIQCIFRDSAKAPRHYELGMYGTIPISGGVVHSVPHKADSVIAVDYAYTKYPHEISPGLHSIAFRNAGKQRHEIGVDVLKLGFTLDSVIAYDKRGADVDPLFEPGGLGVLHSRSGETALGTLDIDFLPGREYVIECSFQDNDKSPPHYMLGMYGSIRVAKVRGK